MGTWVSIIYVPLKSIWWCDRSFSKIKAQCCAVLSRIQLFATPWTVACQALLSTGSLQARITAATPSSRGSSQPRDQTQVCLIAGRFFTIWATREAQEHWVVYSFSGDLPDTGIKLGSPALQVILHHPSYQGSPKKYSMKTKFFSLLHIFFFFRRTMLHVFDIVFTSIFELLDPSSPWLPNFYFVYGCTLYGFGMIFLFVCFIYFFFYFILL